MEYWPFEYLQDYTPTLRKYHQAQVKYRQYLLRALRGTNRSHQINTLALIGLLRLPDFAEATVALRQRHPEDEGIQTGVAFYLHRIGRQPQENLQLLLTRLQTLVEKPDDNILIFWTGFVDTPEPTRSLLHKLKKKSDGAVSELVIGALDALSIRCPENLIPPKCKKDPWL